MCIMSVVHEDYSKIFPQPGGWLQPVPGVPFAVTVPSLATEILEMKQLIAEFRAAVELARQLDILMKKPDCVDPEKAKLEERVAALEQRMNEVAKVLPAARSTP